MSAPAAVVDHVVLDFRTRSMRCLHCGAASEPVVLPISVPVLVEQTDAWVAKHAGCVIEPDLASRLREVAEHAGMPLAEVLAERVRQDAKWGEQNHPNLSPQLVAIREPWRVSEDMCVPTADLARQRVENLAKRGALGYADIALEEFCEAIEAAAEGDDAHLREELIQTAAVLVAWVECIDRRKARGGK